MLRTVTRPLLLTMTSHSGSVGEAQGRDVVMRLHENRGFTVHTRTPTQAGCVTGSGLFDRFQSERESGDRNFAIGYYLKEKKVRL